MKATRDAAEGLAAGKKTREEKEKDKVNHGKTMIPGVKEAIIDCIRDRVWCLSGY